MTTAYWLLLLLLLMMMMMMTTIMIMTNDECRLQSVDGADVDGDTGT